MSTVEQTAEEIFDSVTGFDEIAITQAFGCPVVKLAQEDASMFGRAMVFIAKRREGASDDDARAAALAMTTKEFTEYFAEDSPGESGKDEPPEEPPATSLTSVS